MESVRPTLHKVTTGGYNTGMVILQKSKPDFSRGDQSTLNFSIAQACAVAVRNSNKQTYRKSQENLCMLSAKLEQLQRDRKVSTVSSRGQVPA